MEPIIDKIKIANLHLDLKNYRFEEQESQKAAVEKMIADQNTKLVTLAKDIFDNGLNPSDLIMVVRMEGQNNQYKVVEGNRRVTCLKLIASPSMIPKEYESIRRTFQKMHNQTEKSKGLRRPTCAIFEHEEDADIWIERKHCGEQGGKGTIEWNSMQKNRYNARHGRKPTLSLQVMDFLLEKAKEDSSIKPVIDNFSNTTNLDRLLSDQAVRDFLGLKTHDSVLRSFCSQEQTVKNLVRLLQVLSHPEFTVNRIRSKSDRKAFIEEMRQDRMGEKTTLLDLSWKLCEPYVAPPNPTSGNGEGVASEPPIAIPQKPRTTLISKNLHLNIDDQRIFNVEQELCKMLLNVSPNAIAVLLRVFVEMSVDCFIERNGLTLDGKLTSSSTHESLSSKIERTIAWLTEQGKINKDLAKGILYELNDKDSSLSIDTMNSFVHNYRFSPKADSLRTGWDNIEKFMTILWNNVPAEK